MDSLKERNYGIDIIRIIAVILVLCFHFFMYTNYYTTPEYGVSMKLQVVMRNFCVICVPLFLIITGYLNKKLEYNKPFFKKLINILIVWFFYNLIEYIVLNWSNLSLKNFIFTLTSFKIGYSWYIEMYIGLYLLAPIINNAYNSFDRKNRNRLLLVTIAVASLPELVNTIFANYIYIPAWWLRIYPICYYVIGKYISDVNPKIDKRIIILLLILIQPIIYFYHNVNTIYFDTFLIVINATLVFLLFYNIHIKKTRIQKIIKYMSIITLDIYLGSSLIDKIIYPIFNKKMLLMNIGQSKVILFAPLVLMVIFILSTIYASVRKLIINVR